MLEDALAELSFHGRKTAPMHGLNAPKQAELGVGVSEIESIEAQLPGPSTRITRRPIAQANLLTPVTAA